MFRNRTEPPETNEKEKELIRLIIEGTTTREGIYKKMRSRSIIKRSISRKIIGFDGKHLFVPEYMLERTQKPWNKLSIEEADYFAAKLLGLDVVIEPVVEGLLESPLVCVNAHTGSWVCPTVQWEYAETLADKRRVKIERDTDVYTVKTPTGAYKHKRLCTAIVYAALSRSEPYVIDYTDATTRGSS